MARCGTPRSAVKAGSTATRSRALRPKGFKAPFFQAFIDLEEGPRIFALIGAECPVENGVLADGMEMKLVVEPLADTPENKDIVSYKYVPAKGGNRYA